MTTDNARVRFNPNLYKSGKVCLSLLGTWSGPGWDPEHSSILQVLVSIQSLILNSDPYFNEPGFQALVGTRAGMEASHHYNMEVREGTLRVAVLGASLYPPLCMGAVVHEHFTRRAAAYLRQLDDWETDLKAGWAQGKTGSSYMDSMHVQAAAVTHRAQAMGKVIATLRKRFTKFKVNSATT
jgi:baculoviral IAP repeat-containing protein 6